MAPIQPWPLSQRRGILDTPKAWTKRAHIESIVHRVIEIDVQYGIFYLYTCFFWVNIPLDGSYQPSAKDQLWLSKWKGEWTCMTQEYRVLKMTPVLRNSLRVAHLPIFKNWPTDIKIIILATYTLWMSLGLFCSPFLLFKTRQACVTSLQTPPKHSSGRWDATFHNKNTPGNLQPTFLGVITHIWGV